MKAIVIENELELPAATKAFLRRDLFESVDIQLDCLRRPVKDLARYIAKVDAIIVQTNWHYLKQLSEFVTAFATGPLSGKLYKFYIHKAKEGFNEIIVKDSFTAKDELIALVDSGRVFSYDFNSMINTEEGDNYIPKVVKYSKSINEFYEETTGL